jgi:hypothetical protein
LSTECTQIELGFHGLKKREIRGQLNGEQSAVKVGGLLLRSLPVALSYDIHGSRRAIGERCMENDFHILMFEGIALDAPQLL